MLVSATRVGATQQTLSKGYQVVDDRNLEAPSPELIQQAVRVYESIGAAPKIQFNPSRPTLVWFDTGFCWMGSRMQRDQVFADLREGVGEAVKILANSGLRLLPNAVSANPRAAQRSHLCGDFHSFLTGSDAEREIFCNLIRDYSATLIAVSGRSVFANDGIGRIASARLQSSNRHYAARYFPSVADKHIGKIAKELRRAEGISRIDLLDVVPFVEGQARSAPVVRLIDGQATLEYARAHAILLQAIMLRARRMAKEGRRVGAEPQKFISQNRSNAIMRGLRAGISKEISRTGRDGKRERYTQNSVDAFVDMLDDLTYELKTLNVSIEELGGLVQGIQLRRKGYSAIRTENDFLGYLKEVAITNKNAPIRELSKLFDYFFLEDHPVYDTNARAFPEQNAELGALWDRALNSTVRIYRYKGKAKGPERHPQERPVQRDGRRTDNKQQFPKKKAKLDEFRSLAESDGLSLLRLVRDLCEDNGHDFTQALRNCDLSEAKEIKKIVRKNSRIHRKLPLEELNWESGALLKLSNDVKSGTYSIGSFDWPEQEYSKLAVAPHDIVRARPDDVGAAVFHTAKYKAGKNGSTRQVFDLLIWREG